MKEHSLRFLVDFIEKDSRKREREIKRSGIQIERVRKQLENKAREVVNHYREICEQLRPEAEMSLNDVVIPWWKDINNSGFTTKLSNWMSDKNWTRLVITEPYFVFWPKDLIEELRSPKLRDKPFTLFAEFTADDRWGLENNFPLDERVNRRLERMDRHLTPADMQFRNLTGALGLEFYYARGFRGCGFRPERYALPFLVDEGKLPLTNPSVVIDFAKQIEDRKVEQVIEVGIIGKQRMD